MRLQKNKYLKEEYIFHRNGAFSNYSNQVSIYLKSKRSKKYWKKRPGFMAAKHRWIDPLRFPFMELLQIKHKYITLVESIEELRKK